MRSVEEIESQRDLLAPVANSKSGSPDMLLAQDLSHCLVWVLGLTNIPPIDQLGFKSFTLASLTKAVNDKINDGSASSIESAVFRVLGE